MQFGDFENPPNFVPHSRGQGARGFGRLMFVIPSRLPLSATRGAELDEIEGERLFGEEMKMGGEALVADFHLFADEYLGWTMS